MMGKARDKWKSMTVEKDGQILTVYLHPPGTFRNPNYWAWTCKKVNINGRSLKVGTFAEAKERVFAWFKAEPIREERVRQERAILSWDDWEAIQVDHTSKRTTKDRVRAERMLTECRKAQRLIVAITGAEHASAVDADTVGRFQIECRIRISKYGRPYGNTTIRKTLAHLSASFNRCNRKAGKKCVRGVVVADKLLDGNPFEQVQWVEADDKPVRQFTVEQLKSFFGWKIIGHCPLISLFAKTSLWACGRLEEMTELRWDWVDSAGYISIPDDAAKWGKGKAVRVPPAFLAELQRHRSDSPFVWAGYVEQLRDYHLTRGHRASAHKLKGFAPQRLRVTFQKWIAEWGDDSKATDGLSHHNFRKTGLQWSRENQLRSTEGDFARAANVTLDVAKKHYTTTPQRIWADLVFRNIASELGKDEELAVMMGFEKATAPITPMDAVQAAINAGDWDEAARLLKRLKESGD